MARWTRRALWPPACALLSVAAISWGAAPAAALESERAYELVSPPNKNGGDVLVDATRTRVAADGGATTFGSLKGFGDVHGTGIATEYMSERSDDAAPGTSGWSTHGITPRQDPLSFLAAARTTWDPLWEGELSPDLSTGVFRAWSPLTNVPNLAQVENLYVRKDLRNPGLGSYQLVSDCAPAGCIAPIGPVFRREDIPRLAGTSADFSHVLFESRFQLTSDAPAPSTTPKLYESVDGVTHYVGFTNTRSSAGQGAGSSQAETARYTPRVITSDGSRVFFTVGTNNSAIAGALWMRDDVGTDDPTDDATAQINSLAGETGSGTGSVAATYESASTGVDQDGSRVPVRVFLTTAQQLTADDTNTTADLYMYTETADPATDANLTRLSVDNNTRDPEGPVDGVIGTSTDGRYVYFIATGQLVEDARELPGGRGIYLWHDGAVAYVGELAAPGPDVVGKANIPGVWNGTPLLSRVTPDGRHLLFVSHSGDGLLSEYGGTDYDHGSCGGGVGCAEYYVYNADANELACASCNPTGATATRDAEVVSRTGTGAANITWHLNHPLSDDGRRVFFSTNERLVPEDGNGKSDAYEYDTQTGEVQLISSGTDPFDSYFLDASGTGDDVFFVTRERLVGWDTDANYDLYDARIGGGFPEPTPAAAACVGEACQGSAGLAGLAAPIIGSSAFASEGDLRGIVKHCKRGFVRKAVHGKVTCKRRHTKHAKRKPKRTAGQRRAR